MEVHVPWKSLDTVATPRNGCLAEQMLGRDSATNALDARLRVSYAPIESTRMQ